MANVSSREMEKTSPILMGQKRAALGQSGVKHCRGLRTKCVQEEGRGW